jgi:hypothetical protein
MDLLLPCIALFRVGKPRRLGGILFMVNLFDLDFIGRSACVPVSEE